MKKVLLFSKLFCLKHILPDIKTATTAYSWLRCTWYISAYSSTFVVAVQSCQTLCKPMNYSTPGFPVLYHLPELAQTHVHWVSSAIQPCHPVAPFSFCPQSFSASGSFQMSWLCTSGGQRIGASASVFPMNIFLIYTLCICRCIPNIYL